MGDLDALLQDFSYLKVLERRIPKKVHRKLILPDSSVQSVIEHLFAKTGEATFERIFNRPMGYQCFSDFIHSAELQRTHPEAHTAFTFRAQVKELSAQKPQEALQQLLALKEKYLDNPALKAVCQWSEAHLEAVQARITKLEGRIKKLENGDKTSHSTNIKDVFQLFFQEIRDYLAGEPWRLFKQSLYWTRYCQWKHLELNQKVSKADFDVHRILGRGGFGEVFGCRKQDTGALFAMKRLEKKRLKLKHQEMSAVHERNVLAEMHSKFVTNLKYAFHDEEYLYLILDLMEGGDLSWHLKKLRKFTEEQARFYAAEIILGLTHIHTRNMIYRDLKPANVLLDGAGHARLSDLGLVRDMTKSLPTSECGTHGYMAPEVLTANVHYNETADWWSLGCVIFQFLAGYTPFRGSSSQKVTKEEIDRRSLTMTVDYPSHFSASAIDLISKLLDRDPIRRLGAKGANDIRQHEWFAAIDWQALVDHKVPPPITPSQGQVNAKDVYDIDRFDNYDTRKVVVTEADHQKYYRSFDHIMTHQWQEEVLESVYPLITELADKALAQKQQALAARGVEPEGVVLQGYLLKRTGFLKMSWSPRYFYLYADRLEFCTDQRMAPKPHHIVPLKRIVNIQESANKALLEMIVSLEDRRIYPLRAMTSADYDIWLEVLEKQWRLAGATGSKDSTFAKKKEKRTSLKGDELVSAAAVATAASEDGSTTNGSAAVGRPGRVAVEDGAGLVNAGGELSSESMSISPQKKSQLMVEAEDKGTSQAVSRVESDEED
eukprot:m.201937 g.201937  ORF g.201937 m.201937 type:complete len:774 (-) comp21945_c0_seq2:103-2424(-)